MTQTNARERLLYALKRRGPQTVRVLANHLGVTPMAIRQQLRALAGDGLVREMPEEKQARGRPVKPWKLTGPGHRRFPDAHADVSADLIASVRDLLGEQALDHLIARRTQKTLEHYVDALSGFRTLADRVSQLATLRSEDGYMAESRACEDGSHVLIEHHCPICVAATACQGFCRAEARVFEAVFDGIACVTRTQDVPRGDSRCTWLIAPLTTPSA